MTRRRTKVGHLMNVMLTVKTDGIMLDQLDEIAAREGVTRSALHRLILQEGIEKRNSSKYRDKLFPD